MYNHNQPTQKRALAQIGMATLLLVVAFIATPSWFSKSALAQSISLPGTITVVGEGKVNIEPDIARINIGVEVLSDSVASASAENTTLIETIIRVLQEQGIDEKDIQTSGFNIYADRYGPEGPLPNDEVNYRVNNTVLVVIRDLDRVGDILDATIAAGANNINGVNFAIDDPSSVESDARISAVADARAKAEELAALTGVSVGKIVSISEVIGSSGGFYQSNFQQASNDVGGGGGGFSPGELGLVMQLQATYAIEEMGDSAATSPVTEPVTGPVTETEETVDDSTMTNPATETETATEPATETEETVDDSAMTNPTTETETATTETEETVDDSAMTSPTSDAAEILTMFVAPETVECVGVGPRTCLQVKYNEADEWTLFYAGIAGFEYEPGFGYELLVEVSEVENPPADSSSLRYTLVEQVAKIDVRAETPVAPSVVTPEALNGVTPDAPSVVATPAAPGMAVRPMGPLEGTNWTLTSILQGTNSEIDPTITASFAGGLLSGSAGCNTYNADYTTDGGVLALGPVVTTRMACPAEVLDREQAFLQALSSATSFIANDTTLDLIDASGVVQISLTKTN